jgi:hypothetical protein
MSDRTRNLQATPQEANDLSTLRTVAPDTAASSSGTDLSSATIQSIPVARLSTRQEKRPLSKLIPSPTISSLREQVNKDSNKRRGAPKKANGIITNPYYKYEGGPIGRLVAFLANLLKALETAILRRLKPSPQPAPNVVVPQPQPTQSKTTKKKILKPSEGHKPIRDNR